MALDRSNAYQRGEYRGAPGSKAAYAYPYRPKPSTQGGACGEDGHLRRDCPNLHDGDQCLKCNRRVFFDRNKFRLVGHLSHMSDADREGSRHRSISGFRMDA